MSPTPPHYAMRQAESTDRALIANFLSSPAYHHRHLDWREPLDWLGHQPFWILEKNQEIEAILACLPDPPDVAWVRIFAVNAHTSPAWAWNLLFERVLTDLQAVPFPPAIVSLSLQDWYGDLLRVNGFVQYQDIVVLSFQGQIPPTPDPLSSLIIREMRESDLTEVTTVDNLAFEPIWRLSLTDLQRAFARSSYRTVAILDGVLVGYQMSGLNGFNAHLARLAVHPNAQHRRIGYRIVQGVLEHFIGRHNTWGVTLNTQDNNSASLALYQKIGFRVTGERFPVFRLPD